MHDSPTGAVALEPTRPYLNRLGWGNQLGRLAWGMVWLVLFRPSPRPFHFWRRGLLRMFGAKIGHGAHPYPSCRIWAPWNLEMDESSCLADHVDCYSVAPVRIGRFATVSQYSYLCTASHDHEDPEFKLIYAPIVIEARAWVAARAFIGPGVTIGEGAVVGATASVYRDVHPWTIVGGNPARYIRDRSLRSRR